MAYRAQTTLQWHTGLPRDVTVNTSYWSCPGSVDDFNEIGARLFNFYDDFSQYLSGVVALTGHEVKLYDLDDSEPRQPVHIYPFNLNGATATTSLPGELAVVLSYYGQPASGIPMASRRGRMYLGPWSSTALAAGTASATATINSSMIGTIIASVANLYTPITQSDVTWCQYSDKLGLAPAVEAGWIDNEWDIQRRRGAEASARTTFTV